MTTTKNAIKFPIHIEPDTHIHAIRIDMEKKHIILITQKHKNVHCYRWKKQIVFDVNKFACRIKLKMATFEMR